MTQSPLEYDENGIPVYPTRRGKVKEEQYALDGERLFTYFELSVLTGLSHDRLRLLMHKSGIKSANPNRGLVSFFREKDVLRFLKDHYG